MNDKLQMDDLGHTYDSPEPCCGQLDSGVKEKHYPEETFNTKEMTSLKGLTVGDKLEMTFTAEVVEVRKGNSYTTTDAQENEIQTEVRVKFLTGKAVKTGEDNMENIDKENQKDEENKEEETTIKGKQRKIEKDFNEKIVGDED